MRADQIAAMLPVHTHYIEPFCGSMAVLLAKQPAKLETVNDLDRDLMTFWKVLRNRPADLVRLCALTPHSRAEHGRLGEDRFAGRRLGAWRAPASR
ncbi:DNA adenine methylase [Microtetraspora malaysiensis]|uniref:DNA adenine methylase n=1 Tax=Microtetraspora malaysiensis TaxID=161358 RepID=UPI003D9102B1